MLIQHAKTWFVVVALGSIWGCNKKESVPAAPAVPDATKEEAASSTFSSGADENLYEEDPYASATANESTATESSTSTGSTTDVMGALEEVKASAPAGPDEKAMLGRALLSSVVGVMPSLMQAAASGQQVDLGRVGMGVAYSTGQNMMQQYQGQAAQTNQAAYQQQAGAQQQQQAAQQQALQQQAQQQQLRSQSQTYGESDDEY